MSGFIFRGIHSSRFGVLRNPSPNEKGGDMEEYTLSSQELDGSDGGYWSDTRVPARSKDLSCYFEDITATQREGLLNWLSRNQSGSLVLDERPFVAYEAVPYKRIAFQEYERQDESGHILYSGVFTAYFKLHEPFGTLLLRAIPTGDTNQYAGTGQLPETMMPAVPSTSSKQFFVYAPGTEQAHTCIRLAGDMGDEGLRLINETNGTACTIHGPVHTLPPLAHLSIDSRLGQVILRQGEEKTQACHFHDLGYLVLEPGQTLYEPMEVSYQSGSKEIVSSGQFDEGMVGLFLHVAGSWHQIHRVEDAHRAHLTWPTATTGTGTSPVVLLNDIRVEGTATLSRFDFAYTPRIR